jgi:hypothetical protein
MKDERKADCGSAFLSSFILHPSAFILAVRALCVSAVNDTFNLTQDQTPPLLDGGLTRRGRMRGETFRLQTGADSSIIRTRADKRRTP